MVQSAGCRRKRIKVLRFLKYRRGRVPRSGSDARHDADGGLLVLVTYQVTISAVSETFADSGTGVLMVLGDGGRLEPIGTLAFGGARD